MTQLFPSHWDVLPFVEAVKDSTSNYSKIQKSEYLGQGKFPIVDQGQQQFGGYTNDSSVISFEGCPAIVFGDHTRIFKFVDEPFCLGADGAKVLEPKAELDKKFLFYYLSSLNIESAGYSRHFKFLKESLVPVPPFSEQKRIASVLDKADTIRRKRQRAIHLADDFLRAAFLEMFGNPVTNPNGWEVKPVGDICDCIVPGRDKPKSFTGSIPWITTNELSHLGITHKKEVGAGLTTDEIAEVRARIIPKLSVVMTCVGDLGVVSIAGEDIVINQQLHAFLPSKILTPSFLSYSLFLQKAYMVKMASSTTLPYMNKSVCNSVPIMLAPKQLQEKFESLVAKTLAYKSKMLRFANERSFQCLSHQAFSGLL